MNFQGYDIAIIGAGIIGLATAMRLAQEYPRYKIIVLEKDGEVAQHQTGHNSGVIHAGIYYAPGRRRRTSAQPVASCCASSAMNAASSTRCAARSSSPLTTKKCRACKTCTSVAPPMAAEGLEMVGKERLAELEPYAAGVQAIFSPNTA